MKSNNAENVSLAKVLIHIKISEKAVKGRLSSIIICFLILSSCSVRVVLFSGKERLEHPAPE